MEVLIPTIPAESDVSDPAAGIINHAAGMDLISGRKALQRPIQDVCPLKDVTVA